jgi:hypothetical protein
MKERRQNTTSSFRDGTLTRRGHGRDKRCLTRRAWIRTRRRLRPLARVINTVVTRGVQTKKDAASMPSVAVRDDVRMLDVHGEGNKPLHQPYKLNIKHHLQCIKL